MSLKRRLSRSARGRAAMTATSIAVAALGCSNAAWAVVSAPAAQLDSGRINLLAYGNGGNLFELSPLLFVQGLGPANFPPSVVVLNPALEFSYSVSGAGSNLVTVDYLLRNVSVSSSFNQLRFMVYANPDGDSVNFADRVTQQWGAQSPGDPDRREARVFENGNTPLSNFVFNTNLTETPTPIDAACTAAPGCDATLGLQWNAPQIGPGQTWHIRVGLSDNGTALSTRWLGATALNSPDTEFTLSGHAAMVPEPSLAWLLLGGLGVMGLRFSRTRKPQ